ncbi:hypothetical protein [Terrisporobacter sp.]|uniref:hypothetical protein n=1 Tax=Terrisporobacter sp. TaxID=1965305 RepID=UPI002A80210F|nr:hypothetical protein [Terrisporobacter sp.]MDY4734982.1 hypothetical protein [Terrisporobacter sp.]
MRKYEVSREIYNPCAGIYTFDNNFFREVETYDIEKNLTEWLGMELPKFEKNTFSDGSIEYILDLPRKVRYTFNIV